MLDGQQGGESDFLPKTESPIFTFRCGVSQSGALLAYGDQVLYLSLENRDDVTNKLMGSCSDKRSNKLIH